MKSPLAQFFHLNYEVDTMLSDFVSVVMVDTPLPMKSPLAQFFHLNNEVDTMLSDFVGVVMVDTAFSPLPMRSPMA